MTRCALAAKSHRWAPGDQAYEMIAANAAFLRSWLAACTAKNDTVDDKALHLGTLSWQLDFPVMIERFNVVV
jgi:hypothetical protein